MFNTSSFSLFISKSLEEHPPCSPDRPRAVHKSLPLVVCETPSSASGLSKNHSLIMTRTPHHRHRQSHIDWILFKTYFKSSPFDWETHSPNILSALTKGDILNIFKYFSCYSSISQISKYVQIFPTPSPQSYQILPIAIIWHPSSKLPMFFLALSDAVRSLAQVTST